MKTAYPVCCQAGILRTPFPLFVTRLIPMLSLLARNRIGRE